MPAFIKTKQDEERWAKARSVVDKEYPDKKGDDYWKLVNGIYQKMSKNASVVVRVLNKIGL